MLPPAEFGAKEFFDFRLKELKHIRQLDGGLEIAVIEAADFQRVADAVVSTLGVAEACHG